MVAERQEPLAPSRHDSDEPAVIDRERVILDSVVDLSDSLGADYDQLDFLYRLLEHGIPVTGAADGAVFLFYAGRLHLVASSSEDAETISLLELQAEDGPAVAAFRAAEAHHADLRTDGASRWPEFVRSAMAFGWTYAYAIPLQRDDQVIGSFIVFWSESSAARPDDADALLLHRFAEVATIAILQQRANADVTAINEQLHRALESRIRIEQAKGKVSQATGLSMGEAFNLIRQHARSTSRKLHEVAASVIDDELDLGTTVSSADTDRAPRPR